MNKRRAMSNVITEQLSRKDRYIKEVRTAMKFHKRIFFRRPERRERRERLKNQFHETSWARHLKQRAWESNFNIRRAWFAFHDFFRSLKHAFNKINYESLFVCYETNENCCKMMCRSEVSLLPSPRNFKRNVLHSAISFSGSWMSIR